MLPWVAVCDGPSLMKGGVLPPSFSLPLWLPLSLSGSLSLGTRREERHSLLPSLVCFIPSHTLTQAPSSPVRLVFSSHPLLRVLCRLFDARKERTDTEEVSTSKGSIHLGLGTLPSSLVHRDDKYSVRIDDNHSVHIDDNHSVRIDDRHRKPRAIESSDSDQDQV